MRVERTFAFLDLCGFTAYTEAEGEKAAVAVLARLRAVLRAAGERRGVRITKWLGDGAMLTGVDPLAVVACSDEVRAQIAASSPLAVRGGIARGPVIMFEGDDYVGAAVNTAARLCRAAAPNRLLTAADVFSGIGCEHPFLPALRAVRLDDLPDPVAALEIPAGLADRLPMLSTG